MKNQFGGGEIEKKELEETNGEEMKHFPCLDELKKVIRMTFVLVCLY